jgi:hypothetical protein
MSVALLLLILLGEAFAADRGLFSTNAARKFLQTSVPNGLLRSTPAFNKQQWMSNTVQEVSTKTPKKKTRKKIDRKAVQQNLSSRVGFYYGLTQQSPGLLKRTKSNDATTKRPKRQRLALKDTMTETLDELRIIRQEMEALMREMKAMKRQMMGEEEEEEEPSQKSASVMLARRKRQREFDKIGSEVERWADELLFRQDGPGDGWTEVSCNRVMKKALNGDGKTSVYLKWLKDPRGKYAHKDDPREYPCIKFYSTIDAPLEQVCAYLSQEERRVDYNELVENPKDLEEVTPHSKICWGQTPQVLFIKPRETVTFCNHRWRRDGTQVVVSQACDEYKGTNPTAFALRGATYIGRDPDDPEKTRISLIAHGNPGSDVPAWACKTAVNAFAPIEPFKLMHRMNEGVKKCRPELERNLQETEMVGSMPGGRTARPAGLSNLGFACFWPNGGGLVEGGGAITKVDHAEGKNEDPLDGSSSQETITQGTNEGPLDGSSPPEKITQGTNEGPSDGSSLQEPMMSIGDSTED